MGSPLAAAMATRRVACEACFALANREGFSVLRPSILAADPLLRLCFWASVNTSGSGIWFLIIIRAGIRRS